MNNSVPHVVLVALGMVPSTGGTVQSVRNFSKALGADVISFTDRAQLLAEGSALPQAIHVPVGGGVAGRFYYVPNPADLTQADAALEHAGLVSCHVLFRYHTQWVARQARSRHIPYWVVPHGCLDPYVFTYRAWPKRLWLALGGKSFLTGASKVIFSTEQERRKAAARYQGANTCVVNWPVAPLDLANATGARDRVRKQLGIGPQERVLLSLGRLHPMKQPQKIVEAWGEAAPANAHLVVVGPEDGVPHAELKTLAAKLGVTRLHLPGAVYGEAKNDFLHACDGFISLSRRENFGYSAAEALSAGKPVLLSLGNDLALDLESCNCGWMLTDEATSTAARAITAWAQAKPEELAAMGRRGRAYIVKELGFENFAAKLGRLAAESVSSQRSLP